MTDIDLEAIKFAHRDCAWCRTLTEEQRATEGCSVARLLAEMERLRGGPTFTSVVHDCCVEVQEARTAIARVNALLDEADAKWQRYGGNARLYTYEIRAALRR
jgi:hypothetical protein